MPPALSSAELYNPNKSSLSINDISLLEADSGAKNFVFTITRSGDISDTAHVDYVTMDGTAKAGSDYTAVNGTLDFAVGESTKTIAIEVTGDTLSEYDERFYVELSNSVGADIHRVRGVGTIHNDDATPQLFGDDEPSR